MAMNLNFIPQSPVITTIVISTNLGYRILMKLKNGANTEQETQTTELLKQDKRKNRYGEKGRKYEQEINVLVT